MARLPNISRVYRGITSIVFSTTERMLATTRYICLIVALIHVKCQKVPLKEKGEDSTRIVNGSRAKPGQFPFAVSLQLFDLLQLRSHTCTLSLITPKTCLGAAHCAIIEGEHISAEMFCGIVGTIDQNQNSPCHNYSTIHVHENYDAENVLNDIAMFIFAEEIELDQKFVDTIPLIGKGEIINGGEITALGWGNLHTLEDEDTPRILRFVKLPLLPSRYCSITDSQICIATMGKGVCAGDSGGPNVIDHLGKQIQIGVSSYVGNECAQFFSVATSVEAFAEWIKENSEGEPTFVVLNATLYE